MAAETAKKNVWIIGHVEAEIAGAVGVVAHRLQHHAGAGLDQQPRADQRERQRERDGVVGGLAEIVEDRRSPTVNEPRSVRPLKPLVSGWLLMISSRTSSTSASVMTETKTPAMRLRKTIVPKPAAITVGTNDGHCEPEPLPLWNGVQRNEVLVMQHNSGVAPGSAFQNMKSGTGVSEAACWLVVLASFKRHRHHVGADAEEQALPQVEDARVAPTEADRHAEHAEHQIFGDAVEPELAEHQRRQQDHDDEQRIAGDFEPALRGHRSASLVGEQAVGLEHDDGYDDREHHGAGQDVVGDRGDHAVDLAKQPGSRERAEQAADPSDHDDQESRRPPAACPCPETPS